VCKIDPPVNQHRNSCIEICDEFWPYPKVEKRLTPSGMRIVAEASNGQQAIEQFRSPEVIRSRVVIWIALFIALFSVPQ
jgi:hypothetical protein